MPSNLKVILPDPDQLKTASFSAATPAELVKSVRGWIDENCYGASDVGGKFHVYRDNFAVATMGYNGRFNWNDSALAMGDTLKHRVA